MPITALDPTTALIVIDLHAGTLGGPTAHPAEEITARAAELLAEFRRRGLLVVLANVDGTPPGRTNHGEGAREFPAAFSTLVPGLDQQPDDVTITRATWRAFAGTDLHTRLAGRASRRWCWPASPPASVAASRVSRGGLVRLR